MDAKNTRPPASPATGRDLSSVVVALLKGVLYREDSLDLWNALLNLQSQVRDYVAVLGLELFLDEAEGYGFLRSRAELDDEFSSPKPLRLVARRPLSFRVSLLLALLRKKLAELDAGGGDTRLVLPRDEIVELIRVFLPEGTNEAKLVDEVDMYLNKVIELGFVRRLNGPEKLFEVRRIIKAFVDAQWLAAQRYTIEQCFEEGKEETGLDQYEVRHYDSWYRHITLAMMALAWLASLRLMPEEKKGEGPGRVERARGAAAA